MAFRSIAPVEFKEPRAIPQTSSTAASDNSAPGNTVSGNVDNPKLADARLIVETGVNEQRSNRSLSDHTKVVKPGPASNGTRLATLDKIREQVARQNQTIPSSKELNEEELYIAWGGYIEKLREKNNHSGISNFKSAVLKIIDNNCIEIIADNKLQQTFIENERAALIDHLQKHFNNRYLTYKVIIVQNENALQPKEKHLTTKEQYLKMIEDYPLVKELKDRLKLDLDY